MINENHPKNSAPSIILMFSQYMYTW